MGIRVAKCPHNSEIVTSLVAKDPVLEFSRALPSWNITRKIVSQRHRRTYGVHFGDSLSRPVRCIKIKCYFYVLPTHSTVNWCFKGISNSSCGMSPPKKTHSSWISIQTQAHATVTRKYQINSTPHNYSTRSILQPLKLILFPELHNKINPSINRNLKIRSQFILVTNSSPREYTIFLSYNTPIPIPIPIPSCHKRPKTYRS
jgi:hypothetical protein